MATKTSSRVSTKSSRSSKGGRSSPPKESVGVPKIQGPKSSDSLSGRQYGKATDGKYPKGIDVSYGNTFEPGNLEDIVAMGKGKPPKGFANTRLKGKNWK